MLTTSDTCTATNENGERCDAFAIHLPGNACTFAPIGGDVPRTGIRIADPAPQYGDGTGTGTRRTSTGERFRYAKVRGEWYVTGPAAKVGDTITVVKASGETQERVILTADPGTRRNLYTVGFPGANTSTAETFRWAKVDGEWCVKGPAANVGDAITITKASGETVEAKVTAVIAPGTYRAAKVDENTSTSAPVEFAHGAVYVTGDGTFVKAKCSRSSGRFYGARWDGESWDVVPGILRTVTRALTAAEAAQWGHEHSRCVFCSRNLSDDGSGRSVEVGYGPRCADKHGLPWG